MSQNRMPDASDPYKLQEWANQQRENNSDSSSSADENLVKYIAKGVANEFGAIGAGVASELGRIALGVVTLGLSEESKDKD
ncbi:hypothetical protein PN499_10910 [Kamptonema animale CS-326]|jgi:hypothetical protein|uniref:hypothetical protein n=1 Tax=Kamptonema animale TaxID=92934 RepID=UPI00232D29B9|nr:hypothetical protein [Kamptonema animale]MDB9511694.1 hypothetical protein [Kamptonema animale CS-326]